MSLTRRRVLQALAGASLLPVQRSTTLLQPGRAPGGTAPQPGDEVQFAGIRLCWCPPGRFLMGSPAGETGRRADEAQVEVEITRGFWMGRFEVTQGQWRRTVGVFPSRLPSRGLGDGDDFPVYWVSYEQAERFCRVLTSRAHESGALPATWTFGLPTEAQWEYACRAGTTTATAFGDALGTDRANFDPDAETRQTRLAGGSRPVGSFVANRWGLHDMHGNVWEWCRDYYHARLPGGVDPDLSGVLGVRNGDGSYSRVRRGGAWIEAGWACRSACRLRYEPDRSSDHIGFRVAVLGG